ncbi:MAG: papain-like cysteine protease family protein, partial [Pseudomonadota bacterium]
VQTKLPPSRTSVKPAVAGGWPASPQPWQKPAVRNVPNWPPHARPAFGLASRLLQRAISGSVSLGVPNVQQSNTNLCWAATGLSIHQHLSNTQPAEQAFVTAQGSQQAQTDYTANQVSDIDDIIGSASTTDRLAGSDSSGNFSKAVIGKELNRGRPMIANVNGDHYVIICGKRSVKGAGYQLQIMDPGTGTTSWVNTDSGGKTANAGQYSLTVVYYTA